MSRAGNQFPARDTEVSRGPSSESPRPPATSGTKRTSHDPPCHSRPAPGGGHHPKSLSLSPRQAWAGPLVVISAPHLDQDQAEMLPLWTVSPFGPCQRAVHAALPSMPPTAANATSRWTRRDSRWLSRCPRPTCGQASGAPGAPSAPQRTPGVRPLWADRGYHGTVAECDGHPGVTVEIPNESAQCVYKPVSGERALWDPPGRPASSPCHAAGWSSARFRDPRARRNVRDHERLLTTS
jgi:hypothetical protein